MRFTKPAWLATRTVTRFLWWPKTLHIYGEVNHAYNALTGKFDREVPTFIEQTRWLERASWEQEYHSNGRSFPYTWKDKGDYPLWVDTKK